MKEIPAHSRRKLLLFAVILIPLCCVLYSLIIKSGIGISGGSVFALALMWVPALAALISKLAVDHSFRGIGWRLPKRGIPCMVLAYAVPLLLCLAVYGIAWLTGLGACDVPAPIQALVMAVPGVLVSMLASAGEEIGWRGFLLTELRQLVPENKLHLIIGLIWFFYHMPLILFSNYNNGNIPYSLVCFFFMVMGLTYTADYLCLRTHSFWPAVLLHASHNTFVQSVFDRSTLNGPYTQYLTSEFGIGLAIGYGLVCLLLYYWRSTREKRKRN